MLSRSILTYSAPSAPLAGTSRLRRLAAYTRCLRCAGAPRRPASGSELSLHILSWHAVPSDTGESEHRQFQTAMSAWPSSRIPSGIGLFLAMVRSQAVPEVSPAPQTLCFIL